MFVDELKIKLKAGHGGAGRASFHKPPIIGPDGGNGGKGGDLYVQATRDISILQKYFSKKELVAENGEDGRGNQQHGKGAKDLEILLPVGAYIKDLDTNEEWELTESDQRILISKGGLGGRGNHELRSSRNTTPKVAEPGLPGEERSVQITLRLIADFGLIGLPNAGKSSLLNELTAANVKVANYPFTTLEPNLGVFSGKILADIPGLIEGASGGKGLGIKFLKHIEKVQVLLHCISAESQDPEGDYKVVRDELKQYNPDLLKKEEIILLTKSDIADQDNLKKLIALFRKKKRKVLPMSIYDYDSIESLKQILK